MIVEKGTLALKEIRIGNIIEVKKEAGYERFTPVEGIQEINISIFLNYSAGLCKVQGVPLTEEWLLKFGFEKTGKSVINGNFFEKYEKYVNQLLTVKINWVETLGWALYVKGYGEEMVSQPEYVHDIQNAWFVITKQELAIKEPVTDGQSV